MTPDAHRHFRQRSLFAVRSAGPGVSRLKRSVARARDEEIIGWSSASRAHVSTPASGNALTARARASLLPNLLNAGARRTVRMFLAPRTETTYESAQCADYSKSSAPPCRVISCGESSHHRLARSPHSRGYSSRHWGFTAA